MNEDRLRDLLRNAPVPAELDAEERRLRVVEAAFAERQPAPVAHVRPRLALVFAMAVLLLGLLLSPAGAKVRDWIGDVVTPGQENPRPALTRVPGGGELLVESPQGPWIVHADGSRRLLGPYREATWSPNGLFVAASGLHQLSAVDPLGNVRWSLSRPRQISSPRWSPSGIRVAYLAGDSLRVVAGDGTGDRPLATDVASAAPAWRPGGGHVLAYGDASEGVHVINTDSRQARGLPAPYGKNLLQLDWSRSGRLLAIYPNTLVVQFGRELFNVINPPQGGRFLAADFIGGTTRIAAVVRFPATSRRPARSQVVVASATQRNLQAVFSGPGDFTDLVSSPDGERLLIAWRDADQWLFIPLRGRGHASAVGNIARQFDPGTTAEPGFPSISGWCCPP